MPRRRQSKRSEPIAREVRPLPTSPSLEYQRKEAKALLKELHAGDSAALGRVQEVHPTALRENRPGDLKLSDAQHAIAREYGFTSWPRLVDYFEQLERHRNSPRFNSPDFRLEQFEAMARWVVRGHAQGNPLVARELASYVPRFWGRPLPEILARPISEDDARLVVARRHRRLSWQELVERANASRARRTQKMWESPHRPYARAQHAIREQDIALLESILDEHPEVVTPSVEDRGWRQSLAGVALSVEQEVGTPEARHVTDFLQARGVNIQRELNERLLGWLHFEKRRLETLRWCLRRGADPYWMPPNGFTVLEHAIVRYRDGECVDLIAERVTPRRALWIAAGLGDAEGVRSFVAGKGKLTPEGRKHRPDLMAMGAMFGQLPPLQGADDLEIMWEAFYIAGWNGRWDAMDVLLDAGLPVDHAPLGIPILLLAVGNLWVPFTEYLVSRGADLDRVWPWQGTASARSFARRMVSTSADPHTEKHRRILEICNAGNLEEILAEKEASRPSPPPPDPRTRRAMQLAADDACRLGQQAVTTENMLIGFLRTENGVFVETLMGTNTDMPKLRELIGDRLLPDTDPLTGQELPADTFAATASQVASAEADRRRQGEVHPFYLLIGIMSQEEAPGAALLGKVGTNQKVLWERLQQW